VHATARPFVDEWFSYDARGQMADMWESTPHDGGGYYHTTASYFANGSVNTLAGIPGYSTDTYGLDGEGRPYSLMEGTTYVIHDTSYTAASQPWVVDVGAATGDSDNYGYDSKTGRMTNWTFTVGSTPASQTGTLTWNPKWDAAKAGDRRRLQCGRGADVQLWLRRPCPIGN